MKLPSKLSRSERVPRPEGVKKAGRWKKPKHCNFVRGHACTACGSTAGIQVAHVRNGTDCGMGTKPSDYYTVSLCDACHTRQHNVGEETFWAEAEMNALEACELFAKASPCAREIAEHKREVGNA